MTTEERLTYLEKMVQTLLDQNLELATQAAKRASLLLEIGKIVQQ